MMVLFLAIEVTPQMVAILLRTLTILFLYTREILREYYYSVAIL